MNTLVTSVVIQQGEAWKDYKKRTGVKEVKGTCNILLNDGSRKEVDCWTLPAIPTAEGLAVIEDPTRHIVGANKVWKVTHIPSGKSVLTGFSRKYLAFSAITSLASMPEGFWNSDEETIKSNKEVTKVVTEAKYRYAY